MHFRILLLRIKIIMIIIQTYLFLWILSNMLSLSRVVLSKLSETTSPQKLFSSDCITLYPGIRTTYPRESSTSSGIRDMGNGSRTTYTLGFVIWDRAIWEMDFNRTTISDLCLREQIKIDVLVRPVPYPRFVRYMYNVYAYWMRDL